MGLPMVGKLYVLSKGDPFYCGTRAQADSGRPPEGDPLAPVYSGKMDTPDGRL